MPYIPEHVLANAAEADATEIQQQQEEAAAEAEAEAQQEQIAQGGIPDFVNQNAQEADETEIQQQQEEAANTAAQEAAIQAERDAFNKTNQYLDSNSSYFADILKSIGWRFNNLFAAGDEEDLKKAIYMPNEDVAAFVTQGQTSDNLDGSNKGMWFLPPATSGSTEPQHYFDNFYKKIACCTGRTSIPIPVQVRDENGEQQKVYKTVVFDHDQATCTINGVNWYDDNTTPEAYNQNCDKFMTRLIAFLTKYDPDNPMIEEYGGCIANKFLDNIDPNIVNDEVMMNLVNVNRKCVVAECNNPFAYKRAKERYTCETTFCNAEINFDNITAGGDVSVLDTTITQQCGANSDLSKRLAGEDVPVQDVAPEPDTVPEPTPEPTETSTETSTEPTTETSSNFFTVIADFFSTLFSTLFGLESFTITNSRSNTYINIAIIIIVCALIFLAYDKLKR